MAALNRALKEAEAEDEAPRTSLRSRDDDAADGDKAEEPPAE